MAQSRLQPVFEGDVERPRTAIRLRLANPGRC